MTCQENFSNLQTLAMALVRFNSDEMQTCAGKGSGLGCWQNRISMLGNVLYRNLAENSETLL